MTRAVDVWELRRLFNESGLAERAAAGELYLETLKRSPADRELGLPEDTMSHMIWYHEVNPHLHRVALVHQMERPDATIIASGKPDPKWLLVGTEILIPARQKGRNVT